MENKALIVGAAPGNIGSAIEQTVGDTIDVDAISINGPRQVPTVEDIYKGKYRHLIISCGFMAIKPIEVMGPNLVDAIIKANLTTPLQIISNFIQATVRPQPEGECCVIVIGSYAYDHILSNSTPYCAAKAGINHAIKSLAWDYTGKGYRFHCVNPHSVEDTPMTAQVLKQIQVTKHMSEGEALDYWQRTVLLSNRLTRKEVADTVAWLLFDAPTAHLSGTSIELYGGER